ncbi:hypothetical protein BVRB_022730, partial [Beta vulgaris subsp. vulgaris]
MASLAMATHSFSDGWKGCVEIGGRDLYCHAIWSCPDSQLLQCVHAANEADQRDDIDERLESLCVLNVVDQILHKKLPPRTSIDAKDKIISLMHDSYVSLMAHLWSLPRSEAIALLEQTISTVDDADFALRFVSTTLLADRGADVCDLLSASTETLLSELSEERSIVALQQRRRQIERTSNLLHGVDIDFDLEHFIS